MHLLIYCVVRLRPPTNSSFLFHQGTRVLGLFDLKKLQTLAYLKVCIWMKSLYSINYLHLKLRKSGVLRGVKLRVLEL